MHQVSFLANYLAFQDLLHESSMKQSALFTFHYIDGCHINAYVNYHFLCPKTGSRTGVWNAGAELKIGPECGTLGALKW